MNLGLNNKIALVCAASQGLGFAVADELAAEGASLIICSRSDANISKAADAIRDRRGGGVLAVAGDLSVAADIERIVAAGIEKFGRIDILVTNGGGPPAGNFDSLDAAAWETATRVVLTSVLYLTRLVLPGMKERGWGRILNITSIASKQPVENLMLSNSLRAAVTGFAKTLAGEVAAAATYDGVPRAGLRVLVRTGAVPNEPVFFHPRVPAATRDRISAALIGLAATPEGAELLRATGGITGFVPASDVDYETVSALLAATQRRLVDVVPDGWRLVDRNRLPPGNMGP